MCGSADVATDKKWIKSVNAKCGCVGKKGCADNSCHIHYQSRKLLSFSIIRSIINCPADAL